MRGCFLAFQSSVVALALLAVAPSDGRGQISNGDFEQGGHAWSATAPAESGCEAPHVVTGMNLPLPPGASEGRQHAALLGDVDSLSSRACNPSMILQTFSCEQVSTEAYCSVSFDVACYGCAGRAYVVLEVENGRRAWLLPCDPQGQSGRYTASIQGCGPATVYFLVANHEGDVRSVMYLDNVASACLVNPRISDQLAEVDPAFVPDLPTTTTFTTYPVSMRGLPVDCNENGVADVVEICADPGIDGNGDGLIDSCSPLSRRVNWYVVFVGVVLLVVIARRLMASRRTRYHPR